LCNRITFDVRRFMISNCQLRITGVPIKRRCFSRSSNFAGASRDAVQGTLAKPKRTRGRDQPLSSGSEKRGKPIFAMLCIATKNGPEAINTAEIQGCRTSHGQTTSAILENRAL
jgi:hypothetical protein